MVLMTAATAAAKFPGEALATTTLTWSGVIGGSVPLVFYCWLFLACGGRESNSRNQHGKKPKRRGIYLRYSLDLHLHGKASPGWTV